MSDFKLIRPVTVTAATLTSSTVIETTPAAWGGATTYADGDLAYTGTVGGVLTVWESLAGSNLNHAPASSPTWWVERNPVYAEYSGAATYADGDYVQVAATHLVYRSLVAGNTGHAVTDTTKWQQIGSTTKWKPFDQAVNSQATAYGAIEYVIAPGETINSVALLNAEGASATVAQSVSGYSRTIPLQSHNVINWYDWYYEELVRVGDVVFDDIPPYDASTFTVTVSAPASTAALGVLVVGKVRAIGTTQWECRGGIISYSGTTTDVFGNTTLVPRSNAKRLNLDVFIEPGFESEAHRLLSSYMDTAMVFVGSSDYAMTIIYGFLGQWEVPITVRGTPATIEIRGLT